MQAVVTIQQVVKAGDGGDGEKWGCESHAGDDSDRRADGLEVRAGRRRHGGLR